MVELVDPQARALVTRLLELHPGWADYVKPGKPDDPESMSDLA